MVAIKFIGADDKPTHDRLEGAPAIEATIHFYEDDRSSTELALIDTGSNTTIEKFTLELPAPPQAQSASPSGP